MILITKCRAKLKLSVLAFDIQWSYFEQTSGSVSRRADMLIPFSGVELLTECSRFREEDKGIRSHRRRSVCFRPDKRRDEGRTIQSNHHTRCLRACVGRSNLHRRPISLRCSYLLANCKQVDGQPGNSTHVVATWSRTSTGFPFCRYQFSSQTTANPIPHYF